MKFWTIQDHNVKDIIDRNGIYQPDFNKSRYLKFDESAGPLFDFLLQSYNKVNKTQLPGLIFSFAISDDNRIYEINNLEEFIDFIRNKKNVLGCLYDYLTNSAGLIFELEFDNVNPIFVDLNDFQLLMPVIEIYPPYTMQSLYRILKSIRSGVPIVSDFPSHILQAHLPSIKRENVINVFDEKTIFF